MPNSKQPVNEHDGVPGAENPEWTKEMFARSKRLKDLPASLQAKLSAIQEKAGGKRGPQKAFNEELISVWLSPDVLTALRATGEGWQSLIDETLRRRFVKKAR